MTKKSKQITALRERLTQAEIRCKRSVCPSSLLSSSAEKLVGADG